jgi:hypothetical protein
MSVIQLILVAFAVFAVSRVVIRFRRGGLPIVHLVLWTLFWSATIVVALRPSTTSRVASALGVGRGADVVVYLALVLVFYLLFRSFGRIEELERQITRVVRAAALRELEEEMSKRPPPVPRPPPPPPS